jgi:putative methionine-R-sulfoxide reductase with GAF domain
MTPLLRDRYARVRASLNSRLADRPPPGRRMQAVCDALWEEFGSGRPCSWVGFYRLGEGEMTLVCRRDKPACSPIGLHGACGTAALSGKSLVVRDVRELGAGYIACDPRDLSEIVVPYRGPSGEVAGVLDIDSYEIGAFGPEDQQALERLLADYVDGAA